ncbi:MAG: NAD(P)-binding domain-containing protein [Planctomycetales bacterium]|nr:NAD(P)-binding domain-containing protein [Planctomycetales bacterium]
MSLDTPASIAIIGAGPVGVEAALYARYLGYDVVLLEFDTVGSALRRWGDHALPVTFGEMASSLGVSALTAQDSASELPAADAALTGNEFLHVYLEPLAKSDLIADSLRCHVRVTSVTLGEPENLEFEVDEDDGPYDDESLSQERPTFNVAIVSDDGGPNESLVVNAVIDARGRAPQSGGPGGACAARPSDDLYGAELDSHAGSLVIRLGAVTDDQPGLTSFRMSDGFSQIRAAFATLGGRPNLDLYRV